MRIGVERYDRKWVKKIFDLIGRKIHEPIEYIPNNKWTLINNSNLDSVRSAVVDSVVGHFSITDYRLKLVNFTYPLLKNRQVLVLPDKSEPLRTQVAFALKEVVSEFSLDVWLVVSSLFTIFMVYSLFGKATTNNNGLFSSLNSWQWMGHFTAQDAASITRSRSTAFRLHFIFM